MDTFFTFLYTIAGMLIGGLATHFLSKDIAKRNEFNKAADDFKIAFIPELRYLDYRYSPNRSDAPEIYKTLSLAFDEHETAIMKFRQCLCSKQQVGFDKAWGDYCNRKDESKPHFMVYAEPQGVTEKIKARKFYLEKINALLKFADPKH
jgi:hypothetical protein